MKTYISFGQVHTHSVNGKTLDKDCIALIEHPDDVSGHDVAMKLFDGVFAFSYDEDKRPDMQFFPRGIIDLGYHDDR